MSPKIHAIIPARGGSKGIPRKNIKLLGGHPLLAYSIAACKMSENIDRIIVSTEDEEIAAIARQYGAEIPFMRPVEHSKDTSTDVDFLKHFFKNIDAEEVALVRPTTPLRNPYIMDEIVELYFAEKEEISGFRSVNQLNESPYKLFQVIEGRCRGFFKDFNGIKEYSNLPRQTFPMAYEANGHLDIVKKETVEKGTTFGTEIGAHVGPSVIDIDSIEDFKYAEYQLATQENILVKHLGGLHD
jgi:N-acylneuraminate cytidylyltransferase